MHFEAVIVWLSEELGGSDQAKLKAILKVSNLEAFDQNGGTKEAKTVFICSLLMVGR